MVDGIVDVGPSRNWPSEITGPYQSQGYVVLRRLFAPSELATIQAELDRYLNETVPGLPRMDVFYENKADQASEIRMLPRMDQHDTFFHELLFTGRIPEIARAVVRCEVTPKDAAYFNKPARGGAETPPHQDGFYFLIQPCVAVTCWLALDDVDEENGCLRYVAGSHQWGLQSHTKTNVVGFSQGISDFGRGSDRGHEVAVCLSPGDAIFHDALTIHRAKANRSARSRRALGFVYFASQAKVDCEASDRYQKQLADELAAAGKI